MSTIHDISHTGGSRLPPRWGKTRRGEEDEGAPFHRLIHHMIDVASVLEVLLERRPDLLARVATGLHLAPDAARRLLLALTALHDLGKVATGFQAQAPEVGASLGLPVWGSYSRKLGHDLIGQAMLCELRTRLPPPLAGLGRERLADLAAIVTGHHGRVPPAGGRQWSSFTAAQVARREDLDDAALYVEAVLGLYAPDPDPPDVDGLRPLSYLLNGVVTVCDWLGSHERFHLVADETPLAVYRAQALRTAAVVVDELRPALFHRPAPGPPRSFAELFAHLAEDGAPLHPTWLQAAVDALFRADRLPGGPLLLLIEDATGAGKTEAGDLAAQRLIALGRAHGLYAALPTTATADAAFARRKPIVERLYAAHERPQITLAHGKAQHREALARYRTRAELERGDPGCLDWTAGSSKRALLADIGVGTVDQALLGALRVRHATVRLAGLHGKLLLVDEVHAYDDYMQAPLRRLLRHQAGLGQHVVLMSATLPSRVRDELVGAFADGAGWPEDHPARGLPRDRFPALHLVHAAGVVHRGPEGPPARRPAPVRFEAVHDEAVVIERVATMAETGASFLWIRNTVREAVRAFDRLRDRLKVTDERVLLYHARFLPRDREAAEARLLEAIGKDSVPALRRGRVVVATQAAEQSLDLDADELATDLAPIDAILQRLGRRRRHPRDASGNRLAAGPDGRAAGTSVLLHMPPLAAVGEDWVARFSPGTARIYPDHGRLWLGASLLLEAGSGVDPLRDAKCLIETVYAEAIGCRLPPALRGRTAAAAGMSAAERGQGERVALPFERGLLRDWNVVDATRPDGEEDMLAATRLGQSHEHLLVVEDAAGGLGFLVEGANPLERSSVRYWQRIEGADEGQRARLLRTLDGRARRRAERAAILVMRPAVDQAWTAAGRVEGKNVAVRYDALRGLVVERAR